MAEVFCSVRGTRLTFVRLSFEVFPAAMNSFAVDHGPGKDFPES
ncbi:hypothetical protein ACFWWM_31845 [Streptomyces sp. NPDC058682]|nr:hypothetical protein [Streptomyces sp. NBC_01214]MCX4801333.1 hypothetical protein [Streptomyces sp. NBC_01214]